MTITLNNLGNTWFYIFVQIFFIMLCYQTRHLCFVFQLVLLSIRYIAIKRIIDFFQLSQCLCSCIKKKLKLGQVNVTIHQIGHKLLRLTALPILDILCLDHRNLLFKVFLKLYQ